MVLEWLQVINSKGLMGNTWNRSEAGKAWRRSVERRYTLRYANRGMTIEQYDALFASQGGRCAICGSPPQDDKKRRLVVDHNHKTEKNRGLLCIKCNNTLERLESIPSWVEKAQEYLAKHLQEGAN